MQADILIASLMHCTAVHPTCRGKTECFDLRNLFGGDLLSLFSHHSSKFFNKQDAIKKKVLTVDSFLCYTTLNLEKALITYIHSTMQQSLSHDSVSV